MEARPSTVIAFQSRRLRTWRAIRPWLFVFAVGVIGEAVVFFVERNHVKSQIGPLYLSAKYSFSAQDMSVETFTFSLISFVLMGAAIIAISIYVQRYYRCPRCNAVPMGRWLVAGPSQFGTESGVNLNPSVCPKCGVRLR
jgi:glycerol uptake facilitator-like aquaporin